MQAISIKGALVPLSIITQASEIIKAVTRDGRRGLPCFLLTSARWANERTPAPECHRRPPRPPRSHLPAPRASPSRDVPDDSATGRTAQVNYTSQHIDVPVGCLPAHRSPAWMTFKSAPDPRRHHLRGAAAHYRGGRVSRQRVGADEAGGSAEDRRDRGGGVKEGPGAAAGDDRSGVEGCEGAGAVCFLCGEALEREGLGSGGTWVVVVSIFGRSGGPIWL